MAKNLNKQHQLMRISQSDMRRQFALEKAVLRLKPRNAVEAFGWRLRHAKSSMAKAAVRFQMMCRKYEQDAQGGFPVDFEVVENLNNARDIYEAAKIRLNKMIEVKHDE